VSLLLSLTTLESTIAAELRPPRAELDAAAGMDAWIDTYHSVRGLTQRDTYVLLTDSAVGQREEHNLRHLVANLGDDAPRDQVVPFLTAKHSLDYCLEYADRAWEQGFRSLVVLGGDTKVGPERCVGHGWQLRQAVRARQPALELGGWANPHKDAVSQIGHLLEAGITADFYLTQVVSHHDLPAIERFLNESARRGLTMPGLFGIFYYRSANPRTLNALAPFLPVPREALIRDFRTGATAEDVCAQTVDALWRLGIRNLYVSNLPVGRAPVVLNEVLERAASRKKL
jgi:5,10-methylenetetrahydrofolate reductase